MRKSFMRLKQLLWPHAENNFQPTLIRLPGLAVILGGLLCFSLVSGLSSGTSAVLPYATDVTVNGLLSETNQRRISAGLNSLEKNSKLVTAAQNKAEHMVANNYWSHVAPDGTTPWQFIDATGHQYLKAGENLAYGFLTSSAVVQGWMDSPGHRANMLDSDFTDVGFGIFSGSEYQSDENTVVVAFYTLEYQAPEPKPTPAAPVAPTPTEPSEGPAVKPSEAAEEAAAEDAEQEIPLQVVTGEETDPEIVVNPAATTPDSEGKVISNLQALLSGGAPLSMYLLLGAMTLIGAVYLLRHVRLIHHYIVIGEHTLEGHPLLEAGLIYLLIWLVLTATYGVVL